MICLAFLSALVMTPPAMPQAAPKDTLIFYRKKSKVEMSETEVKGKLRLPEGFSTLSEDAKPAESFLQERLQFPLWEATKIAD